MSHKDFAAIPTKMPPLAEQRRFAKILSSWDKAIEGNRSLIAAKVRRKQDLMQQLLTGKAQFPEFEDTGVADRHVGGITVHSNDHGIDVLTLLGSLPPKWKAVRVGDFLEFKNGLNYSAGQAGHGVKVVGVGDFEDRSRISYDHLEKVKIADDVDNSYFLRENDLLFVRSNGNKALIGRVLHVTGISEPISHSGFTIRARVVHEDFDPKFITYFFKSTFVKNQFLRLGGGTNISNLSQEKLKSILMPKPPFPEQQKIAALLSASDHEIELTLEKINLLIQQQNGILQQLLSNDVNCDDAINSSGN